MSRCSHCGVEILDDTEHCPLCHNVLENTGRGRMTYPNVLHKIKKINFLFRLFLFLAIILAVAVVVANFVYHPETWWSVIFIAAEVYGIIMLYLFTKDTGYRIRIIVGISVFFCLIFWQTGLQDMPDGLSITCSRRRFFWQIWLFFC